MIVPEIKDVKIAVVGLGYVGLPLAVAFGKSCFAPVIGFNKTQSRIDLLKSGHDPNSEISDAELRVAAVEYTADPKMLGKANFIVVAIPTPITQVRQPDLEPIKEVSQLVGEQLRRGTVVVYESTVYPGVTEAICVPIIEKASGLKCGIDWKIGYSPERINPGDKEHTLERVIKVVSGMDQETLELVVKVYGKICTAGVYQAPNIKTAEAAKVVENVQRDLNIALTNELALIFHRLGINTQEVIDAASTKWNFHKYQPGLVGGHCIGVDSYYLTYCAQELGYSPEVILAGCRLNDWMSQYVAELMLQGFLEAGTPAKGARVLVLGLTFKENIRDIRNSKIKDTIKKLSACGVIMLGYDPNLTFEEVEKFGVEYVDDLDSMGKVDGIILAVMHNQFKKIQLDDLSRYYKQANNYRGVLVDIKSWFLSIITAQKSQGKDLALIYKCL